VAPSVNVKPYRRRGKLVKGHKRRVPMAQIAARHVKPGQYLYSRRPHHPGDVYVDALHVSGVQHGKRATRISGYEMPATARGGNVRLDFPRGHLFWHQPGRKL
jgi:hypothetical protein